MGDVLGGRDAMSLVVVKAEVGDEGGGNTD